MGSLMSLQFFGLTSSKSEKEKEMLWLSLKHLHLSEMTCGCPVPVAGGKRCGVLLPGAAHALEW